MAFRTDNAKKQEPSGQQRLDVTPPYDPSGLYYALWRLIWPAFLNLVRKQDGRLGLRPPAQRLRWLERLLYGVRTNGVGTIFWPVTLLFYCGRRLFRPEPLRISMKLDDLGWWELYIAGSIRRVLGHGEVIHLAIFMVGTFLSLLGLFDKFGVPAFWLIAWIYVAFPYLILGVCYAAYATLRTLPPAEYASVALAGRSEAVVLRALTFEMLAGVREFRGQIAALDGYLADYPWLGQRMPVDKEVDKFIRSVKNDKESILDAMLEKYRRDDTSSRELRRRLLAMKEFAATMLGIQKRRLCDRLLDYSPSAHQELAHHYADLWAAMLRDDSGKNGVESIRVANAARCCWMANLFEQKELALDNFFQMVTLYVPICRIASRRSTSGAVLDYVSTLYSIADQTLGALGGKRSVTNYSENWKLAADQFKFLYEKQKAYPGVDIHDICTRVSGGYTSELVRDFLVALRGGNVCAPQDEDKAVELLRDLRGLAAFIDEHVINSRLRIVEGFCGSQLEWLNKATAPSEAFIVTHGYSKTVRAVLNDTKKRLAGFKVLVMNAGEDDFEDARKMVYELTELPQFKNRVVSIGDESVLAGLIRRGDRVMALLGAECFDSGRRVIHSRGVHRKLVDMREAINKQKADFRVVVVAENYKLHDGLLTDEEFFRSHLDRADVYPANLELITG